MPEGEPLLAGDEDDDRVGPAGDQLAAQAGRGLLGLRSRTPETTVALATTAQGCGYLIMAVGPLGVGVLRGLTGDYTGMFLLAAIDVLGLGLSGWLATRPRYVDDEVAGRFPEEDADVHAEAGTGPGPHPRQGG